VKIAANQVNNYINSFKGDLRAVLVYGPNTGLVRERISFLTNKTAVNPKDPFQVTEINTQSLAKHVSILLDEVLSISFSGERRVLVVRSAGEEIAPSISDVLDSELANDPLAALVIIGSDNLTPRSSLRRLFEQNDSCIALPCYDDDKATVSLLISNELASENIRTGPGALNTILGLLGNDRQLNRQEIEKLALFAGPGEELTEEMVLTCLGDNAEATNEEVILSSADGDYEGLMLNLSRIWENGSDPVSVIRSAQRHFQRLHYVLSAINTGVSVDTALKQLRPPIFWRTTSRFKSQLYIWSLEFIESSLLRLTEAEISVIKGSIPGSLACDRALLAISQFAKKSKSKKL
jgi:DNA polymerase-3 subunit delta